MGEWLLLVGICFVGAMVPGANTALVLRRTLAGDRKGAFITVSGLSLGLATHVIASMLGITALISETPALYDAIRWLGSAYLVYMGATYLLTRGSNNPEEESNGHLSLSNPFLSGLMVSLLNPKLLLMFIALFSQIIDAAHGWQMMTLYGATPLVTEALWLTLIIVLLSRPAIQSRMNKIRKGLERMIGGGLVLLGIKVGLG